MVTTDIPPNGRPKKREFGATADGLACELLNSVEQIRGFGPVKEETMRDHARRRAAILQQIQQPAQPANPAK